MPKGKEFWSRDFATRFGHTKLVDEKDKYLFAAEPPRYRFNVIGTGTMGLEHLRVTMFEGRAMIHGVYDPEPLSVTNAKSEFARYSDEPLQVYDSLEAACNDPEVDGLIICTPNYTHIDVVRNQANTYWSKSPLRRRSPIPTRSPKSPKNTRAFSRSGCSTATSRFTPRRSTRRWCARRSGQSRPSA